jgi:hypothetical protein
MLVLIVTYFLASFEYPYPDLKPYIVCDNRTAFVYSVTIR